MKGRINIIRAGLVGLNGKAAPAQQPEQAKHDSCLASARTWRGDDKPCLNGHLFHPYWLSLEASWRAEAGLKRLS